MWKKLNLLVFVLFILSCSQTKETVTVFKSADYINPKEKDATFGMMRMISEAKKTANSKVIIEKGTYHFYPEKAFQKYCFISNHDDGLRSTPFPILGCNNMEIVADGAEFIFHGLMLPFIIEDSKNISLKGFSIDWEIPLYSQVEVVATDARNHTFDVKVDCDYEIRNHELLFLKEGYEHNLNRSVCWDSKTKAVLYNSVKYATLVPYSNKSLVRDVGLEPFDDPDLSAWTNRQRGTELSLTAEETEPGIVRLSGHKKELPPVGCIIVAKGENSVNRLAPAIRCLNSENLIIEDVNVYHAGGMGLICERTNNVALDNFNVKLKPGSERLLTTTADATHFTNCKGKVNMKNCLFENMLDDATNIHGMYVKVNDIINENTIGVKIGHFQQYGFDFAMEGDEISFIKEEKELNSFFSSVVEKVEKINKRYYLITLADKIPEDVSPGIFVDNFEWYPEVEIRNCTCRNNRARGFLFGTPKKIVFEENTVSTMKEAVKLRGCFGRFWYESGIIKGCYIANNNFGDCGYGAANFSSVISTISDKSEINFRMGKVVIENNLFETFNPLILQGSGIDSLVFKNNAVKKSNNYIPFNENSPVVEIDDINFTDISGNLLEDGYRLK